MTSTDLRIRYKSEAGWYPYHGSPFISCNHFNTTLKLTSSYGIWLEETFVYLRDQYLLETTYSATYKYVRKPSLSSIHNRTKMGIKFKQDKLTNSYVKWLEEKICNSYDS
jgi:hypothetical protein